MKLIPTKCPNCGASIEIDALQDSYRCDYCHTTFTDADFKRVEINKTERIVDEAKIREQDANIEKQRTDRLVYIILLSIAAFSMIWTALSQLFGF